MNNDEEYNDSGKDVRKGKWTPEEENYSNKIIAMFNQGLLYIPAGTTLRSYLSEKLSCDPMRITKKFAGASCIGKQVFHPCEFSETNNILRKEGHVELNQLEILFQNRLRSKSSALDKQLFAPTHSPGGGRGVKNKHNPSLVESDRKSSSQLPEDTRLSSSERNRSVSGESGSYIVVKSDPSAGDSGDTFQKNKRIMSASDLTLMMGVGENGHGDGSAGVAYSAGSTTSFLLGASTPSRRTPQKPKRTVSSARLVRESSDTIAGHSSSLRIGKKCHSTMDLANYEKLASDDVAAADLFFQFVQQLGDKYVSQGPQSNLTSKAVSVDHLPSLAHASTLTAPSTGAGAFMTIDDVISSTVAQDLSSFHLSEAKHSSPFALSSSNSNSRCMSVLSDHSPLLLSNPDLVSLNPIMISNKEVLAAGLATSHTSVQGIEQIDRIAPFDFGKTTAGASLATTSAAGAVATSDSLPLFVDQSQSTLTSEGFEEAKDMGDNFF